MFLNDIGDEGMSVISVALQKHNSLTHLEVEKCGFSVKGTVRHKDVASYLGIASDIVN